MWDMELRKVLLRCGPVPQPADLLARVTKA